MFTQITAFKVEHFSIDQILSLYFNSEKRPDVIKINNKIEHLKDKKVTTKHRNPKPNILLREKLAILRLKNQKK